jgi:MFS family permease
MSEKYEKGSAVKLYITVFVLYFGEVISAIDSTIVASLLSHIASDLNELQNIGWVATSFLIGLAAFQPLYGKLSDIFGRKSVLIICNALFGLGCLICGVSYRLETLVLGRLISGIGGGGVQSLATIAVTDIVPLRQRGIFQSIETMCYSIGAGIGGVFGGVISDYFGWRVAFTVQVPVIFGSIILLWLVFDEPPRDEETQPLLSPTNETPTRKIDRVDFKGSAALVSTLFCLMFAISTGGSNFAWSSPTIVGLFALTPCLASLFIYIEKHCAKEPIIPVSLLTQRTIVSAALTNIFGTMAQYILIYFIPILFASVYSMGPVDVGKRLMANFVGTSSGAVLSGIYLARYGKYYWVNFLGCLLISFGGVITLSISPQSPTILQYLTLLCSGAGFATTLTISLVAFVVSVPPSMQAVSTSIRNVSRGIGSTLGVSAAASIFNNILQNQLAQNVKGPDAQKVIDKVRESVDIIRSLPKEYQIPVVESYDIALKVVITASIGISLLGGAASLCMREYSLNSHK